MKGIIPNCDKIYQLTDNSDRGVTSTTHGNDDNINTNKHSRTKIITWHRAGSEKGGGGEGAKTVTELSWRTE